MELHWDILDAVGWQRRLDLADAAPLQQAWDYGTGMAALGAGLRRAVICDAGQEVALAQVLMRRGLRLISRGPIWLVPLSDAQKRRALRLLARHSGATVATTFAPLAGFGLIPLITPRYNALWNIAPSPDRLCAGLRGKWRNRLRKAGAGVVTQSGDDVDLQHLLAAELGQARARNYRALPPAFAKSWPNARRSLWVWRQGARPEAMMLFLRHGTWASYHHGWASPVARTAFAHGPMLWATALALREQGVRTLDLGDVNTELAPGLAHFKLGTGAAAVPMGATAWVLPG